MLAEWPDATPHRGKHWTHFAGGGINRTVRCLRQCHRLCKTQKTNNKLAGLQISSLLFAFLSSAQNGWTALHYACYNADLQLVKLLAETYNANITATTKVCRKRQLDRNDMLYGPLSIFYLCGRMGQMYLIALDNVIQQLVQSTCFHTCDRVGLVQIPHGELDPLLFRQYRLK